MTTKLVNFLSWDSDFFGKRIASVITHKFDPDTYSQIEDWCKTESIDCIYVLAGSHHMPTIRILEDNRFRFVDIRSMFVYNKDITSQEIVLPPHITLRESVATDITALIEVAESAYVQSRFYADEYFDKRRVSQMYGIWLTKSINQELADYTVIAEVNQIPVGYVTCSINRNTRIGQIGLVGVAPSARGMQLAQFMINHVMRWFHSREVSTIQVVTQGRNISAQRLYQRCGFLLESQKYWYHKWFTKP